MDCGHHLPRARLSLRRRLAPDAWAMAHREAPICGAAIRTFDHFLLGANFFAAAGRRRITPFDSAKGARLLTCFYPRAEREICVPCTHCAGANVVIIALGFELRCVVVGRKSQREIDQAHAVEAPPPREWSDTNAPPLALGPLRTRVANSWGLIEECPPLSARLR